MQLQANFFNINMLKIISNYRKAFLLNFPSMTKDQECIIEDLGT